MLEKSHIERSLGFRQRGLLLERLQLELRVDAGLLSALHMSVWIPAVLRVYPARLLRALLVLESIALSWPEGQRRQRLLIASLTELPAGDGGPQLKTVWSMAALRRRHDLSIFRIYRSYSRRVICTIQSVD